MLRARLDRMGGSHCGRIDNTYYDTPDLRLAQARAALRLRSIERGHRRLWVQTFKTEMRPAALSVRGEWETPAPGGRMDAARLAHTPLAQLLGGSDRLAELVPLFRTVFDRTTWDLKAGGAHIEAAIDTGEIQAGGRVEPILELELELASGDPVALFDLALDLAGARPSGQTGADLCLLPYGASKAARGVQLAHGEGPAPPVPGLPKGRAAARTFTASQPLARAARQWLELGMESLLANAQGAMLSDHPEFVHQARVALRHMRVGMEFLVSSAELAGMHARALRAWAKEFGAVRDWDVLCSQVLPSLCRAAGRSEQARWERVRQAAGGRQQKARARLRRLLEGPAFAEFALRVLRWSATDPAHEGRRLDEFARKALRQHRRRLTKAARSFAGASTARQHKIRLQAKSLRYAVVTLRGVVPGAMPGSQLRTLGRFQDAAGSARDLALAESALRRLTKSSLLHRQIADWTREQRRIGLDKAKRLAAEIQKW